MRIPKSFYLMGQKWSVEYDGKLFIKHEAVGLCEYEKSKITIQPDIEDYPRPQSKIEHTFWHESVHAILDAMGEDLMRDNEQFVDVFAGLLHQILTTAEYEQKSKQTAGNTVLRRAKSD